MSENKPRLLTLKEVVESLGDDVMRGIDPITMGMLEKAVEASNRRQQLEDGTYKSIYGKPLVLKVHSHVKFASTETLDERIPDTKKEQK